LANAAAGIVVGRFGTASVTRTELAGTYVQSGGKVLQSEHLAPVLARLRDEGRRIVFSNGCFDLLHPGHVDYLRQARAYGDCLILGVNDDASVRRAKGQSRPICPLEDRLEMLAALEIVDYVVAFGEDTPERLIHEVTPQVLVKGEDWRDKGVVGREWVEAHGGQVVLIPLREGFSTSRLIDKIVAARTQ
jgi:D-beta-D-heptose 7-phosphate kinase/D-beta-D-heptose 1-phosphate adenosyltransferase